MSQKTFKAVELIQATLLRKFVWISVNFTGFSVNFEVFEVLTLLFIRY